MGIVGGTFEYLSDLISSSNRRRHYKHMKQKTMQKVELKVRMDCDGCELKVRNALSSMNGVKKVEVNRKQNRVSITGYVEPKKVIKKVESTGKKAEIWPYVPYNFVQRPYAPGAYDKKAPSGYVRRVEQNTNPSQIHGFSQEEQLTSMFSDDNPNACSLM